VSSGIEPVFDFVYRRRVLGNDQTAEEETVEDFAYRTFREMFGAHEPFSKAFVTAEALTPSEHVAMQAALQPYVDGAISKTVMLPHAAAPASVMETFESAYELGLKGCTVFREGARRAVVAGTSLQSPAEGAHCHDLERECD